MSLVKRLPKLTSLCFLATTFVVGCGSGGSDNNESVSLKFKPVDNGAAVTCDSVLTGFGSGGSYKVGVSDLRFYISNVKFYQADGKELSSEMVGSEFQYNDETGSVALVDLTSNTSGSCTDSAISASEGTARTNEAVQLQVESGQIHSVSFDVGVPQALMKKIVSSNTIEQTPSPLGEMYWSWASGYRHVVFNFKVQDKNNKNGEGYLHIGSRDCGGNGAIALTDRETCGFINTPKVSLSGFDPKTNTVTFDIRKALQGLAFANAKGVGVACHSAPITTQADCGPIFSNFGLDGSNGVASPAANRVFSFQ